MDLYRLAFVDPVTRMYNRNYFEHVLRKRYSLTYDLGVLMIDIDFFKQYNDQFGHQQGDVALQTVGKALSELYNDRVCRYGGEEFIACIGQCNGQLRDWAEDTRACIAAAKLPTSSFARMPCHELGFLISHVTVSIGGAKRAMRESLDSVIAQADANLYRAKKKRDCVVV